MSDGNGSLFNDLIAGHELIRRLRQPNQELRERLAIGEDNEQ
jgi:hypothetical protein